MNTSAQVIKIMVFRKKVCGCNVCQYSNDPIDSRLAQKHVKKYGLWFICGQLNHNDDEIGDANNEEFGSPSTLPTGHFGFQGTTETYSGICDGSSRQENDLVDTDTVTDTEFPATCAATCDNDTAFDSVQSDSDISEGTSNSQEDHSGNVGHQPGCWSDTFNTSEYDTEEDLDSTNSDASDNESEIIDSVDTSWSFEYDNTLYNSGIAVQNVPNSNMTLLQWCGLNLHWFVSHPGISKNAFSDNLKTQKLLQHDTDNVFPSSYYEIRNLLSPYLVKKKIFDVCVNECIIFRNSRKYSYASLSKCPICNEDRYWNSKLKAKRLVSKRKFIYIPIGPRLARLFGEANLAQLVQSHPGSTYAGQEMWDIHHSQAWKEIYSHDGYFSGDKNGISYALEVDGVNPFHNIGVIYSMTPIMLTLLNLPRNVRNSFGNINLVGIIPGKGKSESANYGPYLEILVDELIYLTGCTAYSHYDKAPVDIKIKLLLYVLDYPGLSKLFNQHGSGSLHGCHWCFIRGTKISELDKVIYLSNRSFLTEDDPLRQNETHFALKAPDKSKRPELRVAEDECSYRHAYETCKTKTKALANLVATATGCKGSYTLSDLPGHNRLEESLPDGMHTVKDVVQNVMKLVSGQSKQLEKIVSAEENFDRLHNVSRPDEYLCESESDPLADNSTATSSFKRKKSTSAKRACGTKKKKFSNLPFTLTKEELQLADARACQIRVPQGFGLKPSPFISKPGSLKSHDWKQLATQGVLKFCLRDSLSTQCRETLFLLLDSIANICSEKIHVDEIELIEVKLNTALALLERDFPLSLHNITTHLLHHIPAGIRKYGPLYGTWMYVYERFNSWICQRVLNKRYPEATAVETFLLFDWVQFMIASRKMPADLNSFMGIGLTNGDDIGDEEHLCASTTTTKKQFTVKAKSLQFIHKQINAVGDEEPCNDCHDCSAVKYFLHKELHKCTSRVYTYTASCKELSTAKTMSSFVCCEFSRGPQAQKLLSGRFVSFGSICFFLEHMNKKSSMAHHFAYVQWFNDVHFDHATAMWYAHYADKHDARYPSEGTTKVKHSYVLTSDMSRPLVTAIENECIWFLNSDKLHYNYKV